MHHRGNFSIFTRHVVRFRGFSTYFERPRIERQFSGKRPNHSNHQEIDQNEERKQGRNRNQIF